MSEAAEAAYHRARAIDPTSSRAAKGLGELYLDSKRFAKAEVELRSALRGNPNDATSLNNLGVCLLKRGQSVASALAFKAAILADPMRPEAKRNARIVLASFLRPDGGQVSLLVLLAAITGLFTMRYFAVPTDRIALMGLLMWAGVFAFCIVLFVLIQWSKYARLKSADAQLLDIYSQLRRHARATRHSNEG